jgi:hypothetical protein
MDLIQAGYSAFGSFAPGYSFARYLNQEIYHYLHVSEYFLTHQQRDGSTSLGAVDGPSVEN